MNNLLIVFIFFLIGIGMIIGSSYLKTVKPVTTVFHSPVGSEKQFNLDNPPKNSQKGIIQTLSGKVEFESRVATQPAIINNPIPIQQGERILTKENGNVTLAFNDIGYLTIKPNSELMIIQTLPDHFVFQQPKGKIDFINDKDSSLSIRVFHTLTKLTAASATISIDEDTGIITFTVNQGKATIAYNNAENVTTVINLEEGEQYIYNDEDREGEIEEL